MLFQSLVEYTVTSSEVLKLELMSGRLPLAIITISSLHSVSVPIILPPTFSGVSSRKMAFWLFLDHIY